MNKTHDKYTSCMQFVPLMKSYFFMSFCCTKCHLRDGTMLAWFDSRNSESCTGACPFVCCGSVRLRLQRHVRNIYYDQTASNQTLCKFLLFETFGAKPLKWTITTLFCLILVGSGRIRAVRVGLLVGVKALDLCAKQLEFLLGLLNFTVTTSLALQYSSLLWTTTATTFPETEKHKGRKICRCCFSRCQYFKSGFVLGQISWTRQSFPKM